MIARFLNATTADGYNPYRVMRDGIEWESPIPTTLGQHRYWSDHQIIYLQKLLEISARVHPARWPRGSTAASSATPTSPIASSPTPTC
jgi:hypothetical protein